MGFKYMCIFYQGVKTDTYLFSFNEKNPENLCWLHLKEKRYSSRFIDTFDMSNGFILITDIFT